MLPGTLGELNGLCASLPDPQLLINTIVLQESKDSSAIENIVTTQDELYRASADPESASHSAKEVLSYREALYAGYEKMKSQQDLMRGKRGFMDPYRNWNLTACRNN